MVNCQLNDKAKVVWDTGAQVSMVSKEFLQGTFPDAQVRDISELTEAELDITVANGETIPYIDWVQLNFQLSQGQPLLQVPFLVTTKRLNSPLIGQNVIEHCVKSNFFGPYTMGSVFDDILVEKVKVLVDLIQANENEQLGIAKSCEKDYLVRHGETMSISCRVNHGPIVTRTPFIFEPDELSPWPTGLVIPDKLLAIKPGKSSQIEIEVTKITKHDILLPKRTVSGRTELVQSVTPMEVKFNECAQTKPSQDFERGASGPGPSTTETSVNEIASQQQGTGDEPPFHIKEIDLVGLTEEQCKLAINMLIDEQDSFARNDDEIGTIPDLKLDINLEDKNLVQKNCVAVPRPLYPEVKSYIEDLLNQGFIRKCKSPYSSPVVCVRKKDQSLRLCVDYRALNQKTVPDRHPIPRVQETLDNLGGSSWFSVLDQARLTTRALSVRTVSISLSLSRPGGYTSE